MADEKLVGGNVASSGDERDLRRLVLLVGAGIFSTTMAQTAVLKLPFQHLLKSYFHVSPVTMAAFFALSTFAWYLKPFVGIISDSVPLFGTRRRHYLLFSAVAAGMLWALIGLVSRNYNAILIAVIAMNAMLVVGSTVTGGVLVEVGQRYDKGGHLSSARFSVMSACTVIGAPLGGYLAARAFGFTAAMGALFAVSVVPFAWCLLRERPVSRRNWQAWDKAKEELRTFIHSKYLWAAAGLMFLVYVTPGFATPLYYLQRDTLKFSLEFIGILNMVAGCLGILSAVVYDKLCGRITLRSLLFLSMGFGALGTLGYLFYHSAVAAMIVSAESGFLGSFAEISLMDLAVRATPGGNEGLGYAVMMSVINIGMAISDVTGSWLIGNHYVTFFNMVWLNAGTTALVLVVIPFLPAVLVDRTDKDLASAE